MNDQFREILDNLQETTPRSRLKPYAELIEALRQRNCPYRQIARVLAENCGVRVSHSTLHEYVHRHLTKGSAASTPSATRAGKNLRTRQAKARATVTPGDIKQRIEALRVRPAPTMNESTDFHFDDSEPLRLKREKC